MGKWNWVVKIVLFVGISVFAILTFSNLYMMMKITYAVFFVPAIIAFLTTYFFVTKARLKSVTFTILLFTASFTIKAIIVTYLKTPPISDFSLFWEAAKQIADGKQEYLHSQYFSNWAYQTGITAYYAMLVKMFGAKLLVIQYINCIWAALTNVLVYVLAKRISDENAAKFVALIYLIYPEPYFLCSTLSNQVLGDCLVFTAIYLFISNDRIKYMVLAGAIGAVANAIRPSGIILIMAVICLIGIRVLTFEENSAQWITSSVHLGKRIIALGITYFLVGVILSAIVQHTGLNPNGLRNNFSLYKFVVGLNMETNGGYSTEDAKLADIQDKNLRNSLAYDLIRERLNAGPAKLGKLFYMKLKGMWVEFDTLDWSFGRFEGRNIIIGKFQVTYDFFSKCILRYEKAFYILIISMAMLGCLTCFRRRHSSFAYLTLLFVFLLYFTMLMFIEIQIRYRYFAIISIFILAGKAFDVIRLSIEDTKQRIQKVFVEHL